MCCHDQLYGRRNNDKILPRWRRQWGNVLALCYQNNMYVAMINNDEYVASLAQAWVRALLVRQSASGSRPVVGWARL